MRKFENFLRRLLFSFFVAALFTKSFQGDVLEWLTIPVITWGVFALIVACSWRVEKEFVQLFIRNDVAEGETPIDDFERKNPYLSNLMWQFFVTFSAVHVLCIALDWFGLMEVNGQRLVVFIGAICISSIFRLIDKTSYPNSFNVRK